MSLARRTPLRPAAPKPTRRKSTGPSLDTRLLVKARDGASCVACGTSEVGAWPPHQLHHRRPRSAGGTSRADTNSPSNLITLCDSDHARVESHRTQALRDGYLVHQHDDPARVPVRWHGRRVHLLPDGTTKEAMDDCACGDRSLPGLLHSPDLCAEVTEVTE